MFAIVLAGLLSAGGCSAASAKARTKRALPAPAVEIVPAVMTAPVRFFTINQVLARRDARAVGSRLIELASAGSSSDVGAKVRSDVAASVQIPPISDEPFGLFTFRAPEGLLWTKWRGVEARMGAELKSIDGCKSGNDICSTGARKFIAFDEAASAVADLRSRVEIINRDVNQAVRYVSDFQQHGVADLWSSPLETLTAGTGDCEDYAIAKLALLRAAGVAEADIKLMLVRDTAVREDHAVLGVRIDGRWLVLDNRFSRLAETRDLPHFMPLFAINYQGVSLFAAPYAERLHHESESDMLPAAESGLSGSGQGLPLML
jgi:predicted transglutaminase-like cysteine proteinase